MPTQREDDRPVIGHVLHRLYLAGAEVLAAALSRRLSQREDGFRFVFYCLDEIGPEGERLRGEGFEVVDLQRKPGVDLSVAGRLRGSCRERGVALLHCHQYTPFFYGSLSRAWPARVGPMIGGHPRILFTEHGRHYPDFRRPKRVLANRLLLRPADRVTAVGGWVKQALVDNEGMRGDRVEVVYNGIDPGRFQPAGEAERQAVREELGLSEDQPVVLQVARFHPVKDHLTAVGAMARVNRDQQDAVLVLVGDGEERGAIEAKARELGVAQRIVMLGVRSDVPRLMAGADVFMLSSKSEGISVTLLEAMGAGLPIATTAVGGNPEVVAEGQTGLLSPRGDGEALGANLVRLLGDAELRREMGERGRQRLLAQFTEQQMHSRYEAIYREMLAGAAG